MAQQAENGFALLHRLPCRGGNGAGSDLYMFAAAHALDIMAYSVLPLPISMSIMAMVLKISSVTIPA